MSREFSDSKVKESPYPDIVVPDVSVASFVFERLKRYGDKIAIIDNTNGKTVTFGHLYDQTIKCTASLYKLGLEHGDVVGICATGNVEFPVVLLATLACGATLASYNPHIQEEELLRQLVSTRPKFIFTDKIRSSKIDNLIKDLPGLQKVFRFGDDFHQNSCTSLIKQGIDKDFPKNVRINAKEDIALLLYTSGTTGSPKGVMVTHHNVVAIMLLFPIALLRMISKLSFYMSGMYYQAGICLTLGGLMRGFKLIVDEEVTIERLFQAIEKYKISCLLMSPFHLLTMSKTDLFTKYDTSSLKIIVCGGAPTSPSAIESLRQRYHAQVIIVYGLTECLNVSAGDSLCPSNSVGLISSSTKVKITDVLSGKELGSGKEGAILVKGPQMMKGYFDIPEGTVDIIDEEGWLHTGDIGHYDDDGLLYISNRRNELIEYQGNLIAPTDIESVLWEHPKIADAAVIGITDKEAGQLPKAFVVKGEQNLSEMDVIRYAEGRLVYSKQLHGGVEFIDSIPRNFSGKILRRNLRELYHST